MSDNYYNIKYSSKDQFFVMVAQKVSDWTEQLTSVENRLMKISQMESFQGTTAESVKAYINEVYGILLISLRQTLAEFQTRLTIYTNGFYDFEPNLYATIPAETMEQIRQDCADERTYLDGEKQAIGTILNNISDLIALNNPSQQNLMDALEDVEGKIRTLDTNIIEYESTKKTEVNDSLATLIAAVYSAINAYVQAHGCITGYQAGDYAQKTQILDLYQKVTGSMDYTEAASDDLAEAAENMQEVFAQQQKDYEEACEARKDEGTANIIIGGLAVVAGVTAIVLTAGAATPVVVVAATSGTCAAAYGVSNMVEGAQDVYYGSIGDLSTEAWNPIRDTVFCGNQQLYDTWGNLSLTVAALCVPANNALNAVAGQGTKVAVKSVTTAVAKEFVKGKVVETVSDTVTNKVAEELDLNKTQTVILGEVLESGIEKGVDKASDAYVKHRDGAADGDFTDRMSYEDAKRYNEFMGRDSNAPDSSSLESIDPSKANLDTKQFDADMNAGKPDYGTQNSAGDLPDLNQGGNASVPDVPAADIPSGNVPDAPTADAPAADTADGNYTDWENTANTREEQAIIRDMEANDEFVVENTNRKGKVTYEDYGPAEVIKADEPVAPSKRMPTEQQGTIIGDRDSGNFEFVPNNSETRSIMAKYGQETIAVKDGTADFSPFDTHDTPWGTVECEVEIGHMVGDRQGTIDNPGNYDQADVELAKKISQETGRDVLPDQVKNYRESNKLTWHETIDGKTMQLVPYEINRDCAHTGGTSQSKYRMSWGDISKDFT